MKIVIFGSTGQIGHALIENLSTFSRDRFSITAVCRKGSGVVFPSEVTTLQFDALDREVFDQLLRGADHVIYAIGSPEKWVKDSGHFQAVNVDLLRKFLDAFSSFPRLSLTYFSTFEVFKPQDGVIRESGGFEEKGSTPYYQSMIDALRMIKSHESATGSQITTIHPAAVYGGLNTGMGLTNYLCNLKKRRYLGTPSILPGRFPIVHVDSLAAAVIKAIQGGHFGQAFAVSDAFVSLKQLAIAAKTVYPRSYQPIELPASIVRSSAFFMDCLANAITKSPPILSSVQVRYITQSHDIDCSKAESVLGWSRMTIVEGIRRFFGRVEGEI